MEHDVLEYKGYTTKVKVDLRKGRIYGKVMGIVDAVNDECTSEVVQGDFQCAACAGAAPRHGDVGDAQRRASQ